VARRRRDRAVAGQGERTLPQDRGQDDLELVEREGGPDAASGAAAERNVLVWAERALEEALGPEGLRLRVERGPPVQRGRRQVEADAGGQAPRPELERLGQE